MGCTSLTDPNVPEPIRKNLEPAGGSEYLLYRPSAYDRRDAWPLVVVCHGGFPDSAVRQIRSWTQLAERHGFVVVAPTFTEKQGRLSSNKADSRSTLENAKTRILSVVQHVRAGQTISDDRVFIFGLGSGGGLALYAGLSAPEVFRAVAAAQPKFAESDFAPLGQRMDPYQAVFVQPSSAADWLSGKQGGRCLDWLRARHHEVQVGSQTSDRIADAEQVVEFYESVIRTRPWLRVQAASAGDDDAMTVRFKLNGTYRPDRFRWNFGDGDSSAVAEPIHRYASPGTYRVTVTVDGPHGTELTRFIDVSVPRAPIEPIGS